MKPGSGDKKYYLLITGQELIELKKYIWAMAESFSLDRKIEKYKGHKPIGLWCWDIDCLEAVLFDALKDYPDKKTKGYIAMKSLINRINGLIKQAYAE